MDKNEQLLMRMAAGVNVVDIEVSVDSPLDKVEFDDIYDEETVQLLLKAVDKLPTAEQSVALHYEQHVEGLHAQVAFQHKMIAKMRACIVSCTTEIDDYKVSIDAQLAMHQHTRETCDSLREQVNGLLANNGTLKDAFDSLQQEYRGCCKERESGLTELEAMQEKYDDLKQAHEALQAEHTDLLNKPGKKHKLPEDTGGEKMI